MKSMTFRFNTEVIVKLKGESYEEVYQQFLDYRDGDKQALNLAQTKILPMQGRRFFVGIEQHALHEVPHITGDFDYDVVQNSPLLSEHALLPNDALNDWHFHAQ